MMDSYLEVVKGEFDRRCERNGKYSLRAFARDLEISPSRLSQILNGKSSPSRSTARKMGQRIGFQGEKLKWFYALVDSQYGPTVESRQEAKKIVSRYQKGVLSKHVKVENQIQWDWYYFAIRRMTRLKEFKSDAEWIARRLGIKVEEVKRAVQEMLLGGALTLKEGRLVAGENYAVYFDDKAEARERMEKNLFPRLLASAKKNSRDRSHHARHYFTVNQSQIDELKRLLQSFEDSIDDLTYRTENSDILYCLYLDLFPLVEP